MTVVDVRDAFCLHPVPGGAVAALRGLTLAVAAGERVVVHGPTGSGKTTLLRVLAGEQRLSAGRAVVAGVDVGSAVGADLARWRSLRIGWIDQHPARMLRPELDVLENVALQQRLAGVPAVTARTVAGETLDRLSVGHLARRRPAELSGGEAQRVAVCAALSHGPRLVLADEPSGELDAHSAAAVYDALAAAVAAVGASLVLVSHDRQAARVADRVVRIRDGRLSETWRPCREPGSPEGGGVASAGASGPAAVEELLVLDDRGWLRLPEAIRHAVAVTDTVRVRLDGARIVLTAAGLDGAAAPAPSSAPSLAGSAAVVAGAGSLLDAATRQGAAAPAVATLTGVSKAYGERRVLDGVDLDAVPGRLLVVRGRSGAGKSTLLRILVGLERPDAGRAVLDGTDLSELAREQLAALRLRVVSVVGQEVHLAETADVMANLELARAARGLAADVDGGRHWLDALGLRALAHREVRLLSGGERLRVAVARALVVTPRLLVLDEPTSALDEAAAETLTQLLVEVARAGAAVIVATHDQVVVDAADAVLDLE